MYLLLSLATDPPRVIFAGRQTRKNRFPPKAAVLRKELAFKTIFSVLVQTDDRQNLFFFLIVRRSGRNTQLKYSFAGYAMSGTNWDNSHIRVWHKDDIPSAIFLAWMNSVRLYLGRRNTEYPVDINCCGLENFVPNRRRCR
jgi:hypothetical protein